MASKYSRTPIEIVFPLGGYSEYEAQVFNMFVFNIGMEQEKRESDKMMKKYKGKR